MTPDHWSRSTTPSSPCSIRNRRSCASSRPEKRSIAAYSSSAATSSARMASSRKGFTSAPYVIIEKLELRASASREQLHKHEPRASALREHLNKLSPCLRYDL